MNYISSLLYIKYVKKGNEQEVYNEDGMCKITKEDIKRAKVKGIKKGTFCCRVSRYGWTVEETINTPVSKRRVS